MRYLLAPLFGFGLYWSFAPSGLWWLAVPALCGFTLVLLGTRLRAAAVLGLLFGLGQYVPLMSWLTVVGTDAWIGVAVFSSLWISLTAVGQSAVMRLPMWPALVPFVWVAQEAVRARVPLGGWTWGRVGFSQDGASWIGVAALAGVPALTFIVTLLAAVAAWLIARAAGRVAAGPLATAAAAVALVALPLVALPLKPDAGVAAGGASNVVIASVQGNVPEAGLDFNSERRAVLDNHVRATFELAQDVAAGRSPQPDFVIWPENASDIDPFRNADARTAIDSATRAIGVPIVLGAVVDHPSDPDLVLNQSIVWDPLTGPGRTYTKRNLVPFGEYVPQRSLLTQWIGRFDQVPRDFVPGEEPGALPVASTILGTSLCFDVAYDRNLREATVAGAEVLAVQTNNATYNGTDQTWQQLAMSRIRAVEHGRTVFVTSTSGVSAVIDPAGQIVEGTLGEELTTKTVVVEVPRRDGLTLSNRLVAAPEVVAVLVAAWAIVLGIARVRRRGAGKLGDHAGRSAAADDGAGRTEVR